MARSFETVAAICLVIVGLSHALYARAWVEAFERLHGWGNAGVFVVGLAALQAGAAVVAFHDRWRGPDVVLTALGWASVAKGTIYLLHPPSGMRMLSRVSATRAREFAVAGWVTTALGLFVGLRAFGWVD